MRQRILSLVRMGLRCVAPVLHRPGRVLLVPPSDMGSLGDQAMLDAVGGALVARGYALAILNADPTGARMALRQPADWIAAGPGWRGRLAAEGAVARAAAVGVIGADVIDGVYGPLRAVFRVGLVVGAEAIAATASGGRPGRGGRVFGCSISPTPAPAVIAAMRALAPGRVLTRDPVSRERLSGLLGSPVPLVADLAFLLVPELRAPAARAAADWVAVRRAAGGQVLAVNASGHTVGAIPGDGVAVHARLLGDWLAGDPARALLLLPHDLRPAPVGDLAPLAAVAAALAPTHPGRVHLLEPPFDAWDLKALVGLADAALTGRMHLAIAALGMGVPPLCLVYQGKFEGLMQHFALAGLLLAPDALEAEGAAALDRLFADLSGLRTAVAARLPAIRALSEANLDWLPPRA